MKDSVPTPQTLGSSPHPRRQWAAALTYSGLLCSGLAAAVLAAPAFGQDSGIGGGSAFGGWVQRGTLLPDSGYGEVDNYFGRSVSASGSKIVVGAPSLGESTGLVHILDVQNVEWSEEAALSSPLAQPDDDFGQSVSTWYGTVLVGAPGEDNRAGSAHLFDQSTGTWEATTRIVSPNAIDGGEFGSAVSLSRSTAAIGAPGEDRVYIYARENGIWSLDTTILSPELMGEFGASLAFDGTNLVVGAPEAKRAFLYTFNGTTWGYTLELIPLQSPDTEEFGAAVALNSTLVAVSAPRDGGDGQVHLYEFDGSTWQPQVLLTPSVIPDELSFGEAISIEGEMVAVGAPGDDLVYGSVYLFERENDQWSELAALVPLPGDGISEGNFGRYVALYGGVVLANLGLEDSPVLQNYAGSVTVWGELKPSLGGSSSAGLRVGSGGTDRVHILWQRALRLLSRR